MSTRRVTASRTSTDVVAQVVSTLFIARRPVSSRWIHVARHDPSSPRVNATGSVIRPDPRSSERARTARASNGRALRRAGSLEGHVAEQRLRDLVEPLSGVHVDLGHHVPRRDRGEVDVDELGGPVGRLDEVTGVHRAPALQVRPRHLPDGPELVVEEEHRQVEVRVVRSLAPVDEEAQHVGGPCGPRRRPAREHGVPAGRRLAADRQGDRQDRGVDDEGPGRLQPSGDLVVDEGREPYGRLARERRAGLRHEVRAAAAGDDEASGVRSVRVLEVAAQGDEDPPRRGRQRPGDPVEDLRPLVRVRDPQQTVGPADQDAGGGRERRGRAGGVTTRRGQFRAGGRRAHHLLAARHREHARRTRPVLRVLVRVQPLPQPLPELPTTGHVGQRRRVLPDDAVERCEEHAPLAAGERPDAGGPGERDVAPGRPDRHPEHVDDGVAQRERAARGHPGGVDRRAVLPDGDLRRRLLPDEGRGEVGEQVEVAGGRRRRRAGQLEVGAPGLLLDGTTEQEERPAVVGRGRPRHAAREHLGEGVLVAAVGGERGEVYDDGRGTRHVDPWVARHCAQKCSVDGTPAGKSMKYGLASTWDPTRRSTAPTIWTAASNAAPSSSPARCARSSAGATNPGRSPRLFERAAVGELP